MPDAIAAISSSIDAANVQYELITQNLANANTCGFKRKCNSFTASLGQQVGANSNPMAGKITSTTGIDFSQGSIMQTGQPFDLALNGKGFFVIESSTGQFYTRNGTFHLNPNRQLVDQAGNLVAGENGPITVPPSASIQNVTVSGEGGVFANGISIGKVKIVQFDKPDQLNQVGRYYFQAPSTVSANPAVGTRVQQGYQESSNVNVVEELVGMITATRLYESNLKNVQVQDERMKNVLGVAMR